MDRQEQFRSQRRCVHHIQGKAQIDGYSKVDDKWLTYLLQEILTRHKSLVTSYLATNFELFFGRFNNILVHSDSYVTKRQSIKLLGEILLDRANYNVMMAYVESGDNLKLCMKLLRDDRKMVQYEGFHVFKVSLPSTHS